MEHNRPALFWPVLLRRPIAQSAFELKPGRSWGALVMNLATRGEQRGGGHRAAADLSC